MKESKPFRNSKFFIKVTHFPSRLDGQDRDQAQPKIQSPAQSPIKATSRKINHDEDRNKYKRQDVGPSSQKEESLAAENKELSKCIKGLEG